MTKPITDAELARYDEALMKYLSSEIHVEGEFAAAIRERLRLAEEELLERRRECGGLADYQAGLHDRVDDLTARLALADAVVEAADALTESVLESYYNIDALADVTARTINVYRAAEVKP